MTQRVTQVGHIVGPGATQMVIVPLQRIYIAVRAGRGAGPSRDSSPRDAYNIDLDGEVDSVAPASRATFSPIPPNNATGNFTKIVQRLPVKVVLSPGQNLATLLRAGFPVETTIHTGLENVVDEVRDSPGTPDVH